MNLHYIEAIDGKMYLRDETDLWGFIQNGKYEPEETELIKSLLKPRWRCMDIGANIGYFTILMAKKCRYVHAFEPEPSNFELLRKNIALNKLDNVDSKMEAVSDGLGVRTLYLSGASHGMHRLYKSKHCTFGEMRVDTVQLDDYKYPTINFMKIDIEGAEYGALLGMVELLLRDKPIIVMEFHPPSIEEYGISPRKVYDFVKKLGYSIRLVPDIHEPITYEELYLQTNNIRGGQNIICQ